MAYNGSSYGRDNRYDQKHNYGDSYDNDRRYQQPVAPSRSTSHQPHNDPYNDRQDKYADEHYDIYDNRPPAGAGGGNKWTAAAQAAEQHQGNGPTTGYRSWETVDEEPEDYDNGEWLDRKTKKVQNDSLLSTRRAVSRLHEADNLATQNMQKLSHQSEQLYKSEARLESAQSHVKVSDAKADHLKSLNRFFMLPSFGSKKAKKREANAKRENEERMLREDEGRAGEHDRAVRLGRVEEIQNRDFKSSHSGAYTTPEGIERDDTEQEIDANLDQLSSGLAKLKMMGQVMNTELDAQRGQVNRIMDRSDITNERLNVTTGKVKRMLN
ncbi:hypothetical protein DFJ77DRAFT_461265 [Powellomyces hirtus]|nr:hypothetical protein DFJ77DRAFT_461265 [Powellomyces hirtus]